MRFSLLRLVILTMIFCALPAEAVSPDILGYQHENLLTGEVETLERMRGKSSFLLFFQPACKWCLRQSRVLDSLLLSCPGQLNAAALGVHGSRHELKREVRKTHPDFPAYMAGEGLLNELNGIPATPIMLLADAQGAYAGSFRGFVAAEQLVRVLAENHGVVCE